MHPSARQAELERLFNARKGHVPHISISDDNHHVTEAIGSYYDDSDAEESSPTSASVPPEARPLSFLNAPSEKETYNARSKRQGSYFDPPRSPLAETNHERSSTALNVNAAAQVLVPKTHPQNGTKDASAEFVDPSPPRSTSAPSPTLPQPSSPPSSSPPNPPPLTRQSSTETAVQSLPLNDIDYESSPAAVAQELSNLQAIRRMSMNVDTADPDLPSFKSVSAIAPKQSDNDNDPSKLFWVPARLHPELAPKEFKTFIEDRVGKIRRRSGGEESLSPESLERSTSASSLSRKKSMLSHQIDTKGSYQDGAERLERQRSKGMRVEGQTRVANLSELEELVNDSNQLIQRLSLDTARRSQDSGIDVPPDEDRPILPPVGALKRSTRTTYRRGSLKKGERVPFSKRAQQRKIDPEGEDVPTRLSEDTAYNEPEPQASSEPLSPTARDVRENLFQIASSEPGVHDGPLEIPDYPRNQMSHDQPARTSQETLEYEAETSQASPSAQGGQQAEFRADFAPDAGTAPISQPRKFQSRIASPGRTTAQLPGYHNPNPLPQVFEPQTNGYKNSSANSVHNIPERKSSHEPPRQYQRGGAHLRLVPGRSNTPTSTLEDISSRPSPLPGSGNTRTDALTMVPTFDEKKSEKKDAPRKSSWKWILGNDDDDKEKKGKEEKNYDVVSSKAKSSKLAKNTADKARLDVLQNSIDGNVSMRGRESLVLSRDDIKIEDDRPIKSGKKSSEGSRKDRDGSLLSSLFGGKKKGSENEPKEKKRKADRNFSPDPIARILKPDIDYNWTRFSILEERAIYRMAHIKLANPRRALHSQVLLSNFMYSYLAKVQMMHPQVQIPASQRAAQQRNLKADDQLRQKQQQYQDQPQSQQRQYSHPNSQHQQQQSQQAGGGNNQYLRWQEEQARQDVDAQHDLYEPDATHNNPDHDDTGASVSDSDLDRHADVPSTFFGSGRTSSDHSSSTAAGSTGSGYRVASTHDYLGYPRDDPPFEQHQEFWGEEEKREELW